MLNLVVLLQVSFMVRRLYHYLQTIQLDSYIHNEFFFWGSSEESPENNICKNPINIKLYFQIFNGNRNDRNTLLGAHLWSSFN